MRFYRQKRRPLGGLRVTVQYVKIRDGRVVLTCIHPRTGQIFNNVAMMEQGGGDVMAVHFPVAEPTDTTKPSLVPESSGAAQGWLSFERDGTPVFSAAVPRSRSRWLVATTPEVEPTRPHPRTYSPSDFAIINGRSGEVLAHLIVGSDGNITLAASGDVRLQVKSGHCVRVFSDADSNEPVVKFSPTREALNDIIARVNLNTQQLQRLTPPAIVVRETAAVAYQAAASAAALIPDPASVSLNLSLAEQERAIIAEMEAWEVQTQVLLDAVGNEIASKTLLIPEA